ncbi:MAG: permease [Actinomycetota bacterium]
MLDIIIQILKIIWDFSLEIIPLFVLAILFASAIEEFLPASVIEKFVSGKGIITTLLSAVAGALIPLCTCGMIPLAVAFQRRKAHWVPLLSFLTAGVASSIPALALTLILGIEITLIRLITAIVFGIVVAYSTVGLLRGKLMIKGVEVETEHFHPDEVYCKLCHHREIEHFFCWTRWREVLEVFWNDFGDFFPWLVGSLIVAGVVGAIVPKSYIQIILGKKAPWSPFIASGIGIPFYLCAGADIPLVKALLIKGAGLGSAIAIMTSAPTVNLPAAGLMIKWLGKKNTFIYLGICWLVAALLGLFVDLVFFFT